LPAALAELLGCLIVRSAPSAAIVVRFAFYCGTCETKWLLAVSNQRFRREKLRTVPKRPKIGGREAPG